MELNYNTICETIKDNINLAFKSINQGNNIVGFEVVGNIGDNKILKRYNNYSSGIINYNKIINN